jgi:hypothetical protein
MAGDPSQLALAVQIAALLLHAAAFVEEGPFAGFPPAQIAAMTLFMAVRITERPGTLLAILFVAARHAQLPVVVPVGPLAGAHVSPVFPMRLHGTVRMPEGPLALLLAGHQRSSPGRRAVVVPLFVRNRPAGTSEQQQSGPAPG